MTLYHTVNVNAQTPNCARGAVPRTMFMRSGWEGCWLADPGGPRRGSVWSMLSSSSEVRLMDVSSTGSNGLF
jgi:hypothetical protein